MVSPNYFISGIWQDANKRITYVNLHKNTADGFLDGVKTSEAAVISLREAGNTIMTMRWDYATANWRKGAVVHVVEEKKAKYLRTNRDAELSDNLDNMILMPL